MPPHVEPVGRLWDEADLVIAVGSDLDGVQTQNFAQPQPPRMLAINLDPEDATKNYAADLVLTEDAGERVRGAGRRRCASAPLDGLADRLHEVRAATCGTLDARALRFLDAIRFAVPDDGIVVADMCIPGYWLAGFHTPAHPRKLQIPLGWGTLGYAFPAALGAALAGRGPGRSRSPATAASCTRPGELATVAQERIPLTLVIVDDGGYGMLRYDQDVTGADRYGVDLVTPDFVALARSFGIRAQQVDGLDDEFGAALAEHVLDPRAERARRLHARAARPAAEHLAELVPAQESDPRARARVPARPPPPGRAGAGRRRRPPSRAPGHAAGQRRRRRWPRAPTSARRRSTSSSSCRACAARRRPSRSRTSRSSRPGSSRATTTRPST